MAFELSGMRKPAARKAGRRSIGRTTDAVLSLGVLLGGASVASATSNDMARELCTGNLVHEAGATSASVVELRRHDGIPYVYGNADFADAGTLHFRCRVYDDEVRAVWYLVSDPGLGQGVIWSKDRPTQASEKGVPLDDSALAPPPPDEAEPGAETLPASDQSDPSPDDTPATQPASQDFEPHFEKAPSPEEGVRRPSDSMKAPATGESVKPHFEKAPSAAN